MNSFLTPCTVIILNVLKNVMSDLKVYKSWRKCKGRLEGTYIHDAMQQPEGKRQQACVNQGPCPTKGQGGHANTLDEIKETVSGVI